MNNEEITLNTLFEFVEQYEESGRIVGVMVKVNDLINIDKLVAKGMYKSYKEACNEFRVL